MSTEINVVIGALTLKDINKSQREIDRAGLINKEEVEKTEKKAQRAAKVKRKEQGFNVDPNSTLTEEELGKKRKHHRPQINFIREEPAANRSGGYPVAVAWRGPTVIPLQYTFYSGDGTVTKTFAESTFDPPPNIFAPEALPTVNTGYNGLLGVQSPGYNIPPLTSSAVVNGSGSVTTLSYTEFVVDQETPSSSTNVYISSARYSAVNRASTGVIVLPAGKDKMVVVSAYKWAGCTSEFSGSQTAIITRTPSNKTFVGFGGGLGALYTLQIDYTYSSIIDPAVVSNSITEDSGGFAYLIGKDFIKEISIPGPLQAIFDAGPLANMSVPTGTFYAATCGQSDLDPFDTADCITLVPSLVFGTITFSPNLDQSSDFLYQYTDLARFGLLGYSDYYYHGIEGELDIPFYYSAERATPGVYGVMRETEASLFDIEAYEDQLAFSKAEGFRDVFLAACSSTDSCLLDEIEYGYVRSPGPSRPIEKKFTRNPKGTFPLIEAPLGTNPIVAWDWGTASYCREQLLALGFTDADLTP